MRVVRFRLRSLMIPVFISALEMAAFIHLSKVKLNEIHDLKTRIMILGSFFLVVVAKLGLLIETTARRHSSELATVKAQRATRTSALAHPEEYQEIAARKSGIFFARPRFLVKPRTGG